MKESSQSVKKNMLIALIGSIVLIFGLSGCSGKQRKDTNAVLLYCLGFCFLIEADKEIQTGALHEDIAEGIFHLGDTGDNSD